MEPSTTLKRLFQGQLVRLCSPRPDDAELLSRWSEDGEYRRLADTDAPRPMPVEYFRERDESVDVDPHNVEFRVRTVADDRLVGFVAVSGIEWANRHGWLAVGIGDPNDRRRGYGTEAVALALRYAFHELGLHRVSLDVIATNLPALRLYRGVGFVEEGRLRERVLREGQEVDLILMGLLSRDWSASLAQAPG